MSKLDDVMDIIQADHEGFWLLIGDIDGPDEPRRREALMALITAAWGKGYESGLRKGSKATADAIVAGVIAGAEKF